MDFNPLQRNPQIYITLGENHMTEKRKLEPAINIKSSELVSRKLKKNMWPQWLVTWAHNTVTWQLSIDLNMDVYHQVNTDYRQPTLARKFDISHWLPCGVDGCTVMWLPKFTGWIDYQIFLGMGLCSHVCGAPLLTGTDCTGETTALSPGYRFIHGHYWIVLSTDWTTRAWCIALTRAC